MAHAAREITRLATYNTAVHIDCHRVSGSALPSWFGARLGRSLALGSRLWRSLGSCPLPLGCRLQLRRILIGAVHCKLRLRRVLIEARLRHRSFPCSMPLGGRGGRGRSSGSTALSCCLGWGGSTRSGSDLCLALVISLALARLLHWRRCRSRAFLKERNTATLRW